MAKAYGDITETVGNTPLVKINKLSSGLHGNIYVKAEFINPLSSIKDRVAVALIEDGEKKGLINRDTLIIDATRGNEGIALSFVCAQKGYNLLLTMPDTVTDERKRLLHMFGTKVVLTEGKKGMTGAVVKAQEFAKTYPNSFIPCQFTSKEASDVHKRTTAVEIWEALDGEIDYFIAGVGSGGTITGVGEFLKEHRPKVKIVAVEPEDCAVLSGGVSGSHTIYGIGAGFVPEILNRDIINEIIKIGFENAYITTSRLAKEEGILAGISSGGNLWAALQIAARPETEGKNIVTILCDSGERYIMHFY
ncbi:MAG: cysteine synthase A [Endomicrobium sp.]|jgi:cysteine synthase A|nr:cysteine synthase A [Endomicrobium sp.]